MNPSTSRYTVILSSLISCGAYITSVFSTKTNASFTSQLKIRILCVETGSVLWKECDITSPHKKKTFTKPK